jgi:AraC-like DNA-binding protein
VELNFLLQGGMTYSLRGCQVDIQAGDFVFFWGAVPHQSVAARPGSTFVCIYLPLEMFLAMPLSGRLTGAVLAGALVRSRCRPAFDPEQLNRLHAELLGPDARLVDLDRSELELLVRRVARAVGLHPNYAMTLFRQQLGLTIGAFLTRQRLYRAQQRLLMTGSDIASVAFDCGFGSVSRFHEAFRAHFGMSPGRLRASFRRHRQPLSATDAARAGPAV